MDVSVKDNPAQHRFELLTADGEVAGFATYRERDGVTVVVHSEVDLSHRGEGLGNKLAQGTLDLLQGRGAKVYPACPFFAHYVTEHHDWDAILVD
ncbi:GNAT family N-acetyltransferase [Symbioplanes lichenis]|uniref:GNAT family N-acetyltransferase n=1 Tax=Symbioplanes lichenis TaxID=1629072 RepID=UPI0027389A91|nr:GNAT family N-acetyltransferase [Actinoplanes lichenis]